MGFLDRLFSSGFAPGERQVVAQYLFGAWDLRARQDFTDPKDQAANAVALRPISPAAMDHYSAWCLVYDATVLIADKAADLLVKSTPAQIRPPTTICSVWRCHRTLSQYPVRRDRGAKEERDADRTVCSRGRTVNVCSDDILCLRYD